MTPRSSLNSSLKHSKGDSVLFFILFIYSFFLGGGGGFLLWIFFVLAAIWLLVSNLLQDILQILFGSCFFSLTQYYTLQLNLKVTSWQRYESECKEAHKIYLHHADALLFYIHMRLLLIILQEFSPRFLHSYMLNIDPRVKCDRDTGIITMGCGVPNIAFNHSHAAQRSWKFPLEQCNWKGAIHTNFSTYVCFVIPLCFMEGY